MNHDQQVLVNQVLPILILLAIYFLPGIVAEFRRHRNGPDLRRSSGGRSSLGLPRSRGRARQT